MFQKIILGIDTSCDETSVAVLRDERTLLANVISSQIKLHAPHGGVVPELASRAHLDNLPTVVETALQQAKISWSDLTGIAVTNAPGLIGCLLVGLSYAKSLAATLKIPLTPVYHLKAHLFSPFLEHVEVYPFLGLVVSGGHTALYYVRSFDDITLLGETVDDAAGEAYDKVAKLLGLGFPGGPVIDRLAREGDSSVYTFTRARVKKGAYAMSFSGLKTAVSQIVKNNDAQKHDVGFQKNLAASFQKEVVGSLVAKMSLALSEYPAKALVVAGGVAANSELRLRVSELAKQHQIACLIPSFLLCTDNGGMVAYVGAKQLDSGLVASLQCNAFASSPSSVLATRL